MLSFSEQVNLAASHSQEWQPASHQGDTGDPCKIVTHLKLNSTDTGADSILKRHQIRNESPQDSKVTQQPQHQ